MARLRQFLLKLLNAVRPGRAESDLARELASHLALLADDFERRGLAPEQARLAARRAFDGVERTKDLQRDARSFVWLDDARWDVSYSTRLLRRNPVFALTAVLSLAIGIGANTTIFTIADALLFARPAGVVDPDRVVDIGVTVSGRGAFGQVSYLNYLDVRERVTTLDAVYAYHPVPQPMSLGGPNGAERISGRYVSANFFTVLGVKPAVGRLFGDVDGTSSNAIAVLSHRFWTQHFGADPTVVGRIIIINGQPYTVVGVAPNRFRGTSILVTDTWLPIEAGAAALLTSRELGWPLMGGRLKPGVSLAQAAAEVDAIARALEREYPDQNRGKGFRVVAATPIPGNILPVAGFLSLLMAMVSLVLIVACANVAGVLLARAAARRREIAVRLAMGAGRSRLMRQLFTETMMLFAAGGAAGLAIARGMTTLLVSLLPALPLPVDVSLPLDGRVIAFTAGLSLAAAVLCGLVPALNASRADVVSTLKDDAAGPSDRLRLRHAFVVGQIAVSILLVVGGALFLRALQKAGSIELGYDPRGLELTSLDLSLGGYTTATGQVFIRELVERVRRIPGVQQATIASTAEPIGDGRRSGLLTAPGVSASDGRASFAADWNAIDPGYFATLQIPLVAGRDFTAADRGAAPLVAIVGEAAAKRFFPGRAPQEAIAQSITLQPGRTLDSGTRNRVYRGPGDPVWTLQVVGVARDIKYAGPRDTAPHLFVYIPLQQQPFGSRVTLVTRTAGGQRIAHDIRALIAAMNPNLPIVAAQTLEDWTAVSLVPQRVAASVSGSLGVVGLLLAAIGIYGVTSYSVARRTREIGIRVALGAQPVEVVAMVLRQGLSLAIVGSAIGLLLAAAAGRLLAAFLLGVPAFDPATFLGAVILCVSVGLVACYVPARRATQVDAMDALRHE